MLISKPITDQLVPLFYLMAGIYTVLNLGGPFIGIPGVVFLGVFILTVNYFFFKTVKIKLRKKVGFFIFCFFPLIILNSIFSIETFNSSFYWILWLMFIISLVKIIQNLNQRQLDHLLYHLPYILLLASVLLYIILFPRLGTSLPTKNSLGLLSGATLIASVSIKDKWKRYLVFAIALLIVVQSDSRSSLVFSIGIVALYFTSSVNSKNSPLYIFGIILLLIFYQPLYNFFEEKMLSKERFATNLEEALRSAQKERTDLLELGWELFKEKPYVGFGLKSKYYEGRITLVQGSFVHVHNGYLSTLIETGIIITFFVAVFFLIITQQLIRLFFFQPKSFDKIWLFFIAFGFIRSYGENYLFFNIGNIFSIFFLFFCIILVVDSRLSLVLPQNRIYYRSNSRIRGS